MIGITTRTLLAGRRRAAVAVLAGLVVLAVAGALIPQLSPPNRYGIDKMVHVAVFALLALGVLTVAETRRQVLAGLFLLCVLACGLEVVQAMVPDRSMSKRDAAASIIGIGLGGAVGALGRKILTVRRTRHL